MPIYERGPVRIHYEEAGAGFPLLVIPGGGLNATIAYLSQGAPFNPMEEFRRRPPRQVRQSLPLPALEHCRADRFCPPVARWS